MRKPPPSKKKVYRSTVSNTVVQLVNGAMCWKSGMEIDADGARHAYHPDSAQGLDNLANAGYPGNWYGLVCNQYGAPYIQTDNDPAPGFFISATALVDRTKANNDPSRYVDASEVPYIAVPPELRNRGVLLGDLAMVAYKDRFYGAIVADVGPHNKYGEGSIALATALSIPSSPRRGGVAGGVMYAIFCKTSVGWPRDLDDIQKQALAAFSRFGGLDRLVQVVSNV